MLGLIGEDGHVNVFEKLTRENAENAVGKFGKVVALAAGVLAAEYVGESQAGGKLFGFDEEAGAISDPGICCFHSADRFCPCLESSYVLSSLIIGRSKKFR